MAMDLTQGKPLVVMLRFVLPVIGGNLFQLFYTLADTVIVGQTIGEDALAAVGATTVFVYFILCFIQGLTNGFSIILARSVGARNEKASKGSIAASVLISIACTLIITIPACALLPWIIRFMDVPETIVPEASAYLIVMLAGTGATVLYNLISNILRAFGDSRMPLVFLVVSSLLNIVLDIIFIVPFGMGTGGAAAATVLSQLIAGILSIIFGIRKYSLLRLSAKDWRNGMQCIAENLRLGVLMGFQMSVMCIGQLVMQASVNSLGTAAIAGYTAATKTDQLSVLVNNAFITAIAAYVAQNFGAGNLERIRRGVWSSLLLIEVTDAVMIVLVLLAEPFIVPAFVSSPSPEVFSYTRTFFLLTLPFYPVLGLLCVYRTSVQSLGNAWAPFTACIVELVARCASSILLGRGFGYGGIVLSTPIAWLGAIAIVIPVYALMSRRMLHGHLEKDSSFAVSSQ